MRTSAGSKKSRRTRVVRRNWREQINGKKSKALRRIVRALKLDPENKYQPVGPLRRREAIKDHGRTYTAGIVLRPFALGPCERRAYQEAKALYLGSGVDVGQIESVPMQQEPARQFKDAVIDSIKTQPASPEYGPKE
jgi:hypothetical protein